MCFTKFLQYYLNYLQELLNELSKKKKDQIKLIEKNFEKILFELIPLQRESITNPEKKDEYDTMRTPFYMGASTSIKSGFKIL